jgi:parallel beta-helix repeat protein
MIIGFNASATNYYFSAAGSDYNSGTDPSSAFKTLNKLNSLYLQPGDYVYFRRGDSFYGTINITRSGTAASPIRFGAYGSGAKPVITGFTSVTSWTSLGGNIWESTSAISGLPYTNMVSINGGNTPMGRYPNSGYLTFQSHNGNTSITSSALSSYPNWTGAEVAIRKVRYAIETGTITSHSGSTLYFTDEKLYTPKDNFGFFIQDDSRTLDVQNEWYYNPSTKKLRVYSSSYPNNVRIATVERLVNGGGSSASYINFDNIAFTGANSYSFYLAQKNYVSITNCDILYSGGEGILADGSYSVNIQNNTITNTNGNAIKVTGSSTNSTVRYNNIRSSGMVPGMVKSHALGSIYIGGDNSIVEFNNLDSSGYNGIRFNANNVKVRNNFINHSCMIIDDGGGIYTDANKTGREITGNIVLNSMGTSEGTDAKGNMLAHGIFLDDQTVYVTVQGNSVSSCRGAGIFIHNASDLIIKDNTCFDNGIDGNWLKGAIMFQYDWSKPLRNIQLRNNIFFAKTAKQLTLFGYTGGYDPSDIKQLGSADYNYYARPLDGSNTINLSSSTVSWPGVNLNLSSWKTYTGLDYNSQAAKKTTTSTSDLRFVYNASSSSRTIALDASYIDVKGISYNGSITLAPYTSAVLTKNGAATATTQQPPVANAGSDIYVTLPTNTAQLSGSGTSTGGSITGYAWTKVSGPSATITSPYSASTSITGLTEGSYIFQLSVTDNLSATDKDSVKVTVSSGTTLLPAVYPSNTVNGLDYKYYEATGYSVVPSFGTSAVKAGTVSTFTLSAANRATDYSFNFTGYINVPADGQYTFYTNSDDGSKLYIDNVLVVNNDGLHGTVERSGTVGLKAGKHAITVGYFQRGGDAVLSVSYSGPNVGKQTIPGSALYRVSTSTTTTTNLLPAVYPSNTVNGLDYKYYEASNYSVVPIFDNIPAVKAGTVSNYTLSPANRTTNYGFNFKGYINVPADGQYTFYTNSDDGSKLYIDNVLVVNNDGLHGTVERSGTIGLKAGKHAIIVGYIQQAGDAVLSVSYSGPNIGKQTIPSSVLYRSLASTTVARMDMSSATATNQVNGSLQTNTEVNNQALGNNQEKTKISVYPNPFSDHIEVHINQPQAGAFRLMLMDAAGKVLWNTESVNGSTSYHEIVNTSTFPIGVYFLKMIQNDKSTTVKLIKQYKN